MSFPEGKLHLIMIIIFKTYKAHFHVNMIKCALHTCTCMIKFKKIYYICMHTVLHIVTVSNSTLGLCWYCACIWLIWLPGSDCRFSLNFYNPPTCFSDIVTVLKGHTGMVKGVTWDPVGKYLASQSDDKTLRVWRTSDWQQESAVSEPFADCSGTTHVLRISWSPDGHYVVSAHAMNNGGPVAKILERDGWKMKMDFVGHRKAVTCVVRVQYDKQGLQLLKLNYFSWRCHHVPNKRKKDKSNENIILKTNFPLPDFSIYYFAVYLGGSSGFKYNIKAPAKLYNVHVATSQRNKLHIQHCWSSICKFRPNDRNIWTQQITTLLGATCCMHLATLLQRGVMSRVEN